MSMNLPSGRLPIQSGNTTAATQTKAKAQALQTAVRNLVGPKEFQANAQVYLRICGYLAAYEGATPQQVLDIANTMKTNIFGQEGTFTYGDDKAMVILNKCLSKYPDATAEDFAAIYKVFSNQPGIFEIMAERYINQHFNPAPKELPEQDLIDDANNASLSKAPRNPEETETEPEAPTEPKSEAPSVPTTGTTIGPKVGTPLGEGAGGFTKAPVSGSDILANQNRLLVGGDAADGIKINDKEETGRMELNSARIYDNDKKAMRALRRGRVKEGDLMLLPGKGIGNYHYSTYIMRDGQLVELTDISEIASLLADAVGMS